VQCFQDFSIDFSDFLRFNEACLPMTVASKVQARTFGRKIMSDFV
jgi:hypothetical protein